MENDNTIKSTDKNIYDNVTSGDFYHSSWSAATMFEYEQKILTRWIGLERVNSNSVALEIGCGAGHQITWLRNFGDIIIGLDHSIKSIKEAHIDHRSDSNILFLLSDAEQIPFRPKSVDMIMCGAILHHLPNYQNALQEFRSCLKENGVVAAVEPCAYNPFAVLRRKYFPSIFHTPDERPFPPNEIICEFKKNFDIVHYRRSFIFSINASLVEKILGRKVAKLFLYSSLFVDNILCRIPLIRQLCWRIELVGIKKPRS